MMLENSDRCAKHTSLLRPQDALRCACHWMRSPPLPLLLFSEIGEGRMFAAYRAAGTNAGNERKRDGFAEVTENRKVYGTQ